ncbi:MAG: AAA family ATPase [Planctomycetota bacterium]|jgi:tetratricopeptide (TPR) repeat protein
MALVAHKYMPQEMPDAELRATFAAREHTLDYLLKSLREQCDSKTLTSYLITGPRGAGKTTIVLMLCLRMREDARLSAAWLPVRFPEELPGITSLRDLLAATLHVMAEDGIADAAPWHEKVEKEADDEQSLELAVSGLRQIAGQQGRRLVLFVENFDLVFDRGLDERGQKALRRLLMDGPFMMIVGTAVNQFEAVRVYEEAFFNYFCPVPLERLNDEQVSQILFRRAEYDGNEKFGEQYRRYEGRVKAISRLTGGNPRLVLMLYEVLAHGDLGSTVNTLRSLVDELTPLLKDILEHQFSDQQSKILDALMRSGGTATPSEVARAARLGLNTVTTQLSRLKEMQIVDLRGGGKGRAAYYTVPDQLFCTWYQMRYLRQHRRRIEMFVEVLRVWYEEEQRLRIMRDRVDEALRSQGKAARDAATAAEYFSASLAATDYHREAQELIVGTWLQIGSLDDAALALVEDSDFGATDGSGYEATAYARLGQWAWEHDDPATEMRALRSAIERSPEDWKLHLRLGLALARCEKHDAAQEHFGQVIECQEAGGEFQAAGFLNRGLCKEAKGDTEGAIADFTNVLHLDSAQIGVVALTLLKRGVAKGSLGDTEGEIADYTAVVELEGAPTEDVALALVKRGVTKARQGDTEGAIADYTAVVELEGAATEHVRAALLSRGACKAKQGDMDGAIADCTAVVEYEGAATEQVAIAHLLRGVSKWRRADTDGAIADFTAVAELQGAPTNELAHALLIRGSLRMLQRDAEDAIADFDAVRMLDGAAGDQVAMALFARGACMGSQGDMHSCADDLLVGIRDPNVDGELRTSTLNLVFRIACREQSEALLQRAARASAEGLSHLPPGERAEELESVLLHLASPDMKSAWPRVVGSLLESQPAEVLQRLEFFRPAAQILQTGDLSMLDPLPPEQREFVREVLDKFEADPAQRE